MAHSRTLALQDRTLLFLSLVCFFNFTGLNNGLTTFVVSSGRIQRVEFAPWAIQKAAAALNPLNWKTRLFDPVWRQVLARRDAVAVCAERIQSMLAESELSEIWMEQFRKDNLDQPAASGRIIPVSLDGAAESGWSPAVSADSFRFTPVFPAVRAPAALETSRGRVLAGAFDGYLRTQSKESWLDASRSRFLDGRKYRAGFGFLPARSQWRGVDCERGGPLLTASAGESLSRRRSPAPQRIAFTSESDRGDDSGPVLSGRMGA